MHRSVNNNKSNVPVRSRDHSVESVRFALANTDSSGRMTPGGVYATMPPNATISKAGDD